MYNFHLILSEIKVNSYLSSIVPCLRKIQILSISFFYIDFAWPTVIWWQFFPINPLVLEQSCIKSHAWRIYNVYFFNILSFSYLMDDPQIKLFVEKTDKIKEKLNQASKLVYHTKPHPVDREALNSYLDNLKVRGCDVKRWFFNWEGESVNCSPLQMSDIAEYHLQWGCDSTEFIKSIISPIMYIT